MPPLKNTRHEKFCLLLAKGSSGQAAYEKVFSTKGKSAGNCAHRLLEKAGIRERVQELQQAAADETIMDLREIQQFLAEVKRTPAGHVDENSPLCQSYKYTVSGGSRGRLRRGQADSGNEIDEEEQTTIEIKMPCKLKATELSAKLSGFLTEKKEVAISGLATPVELEERVRAASVLLGGTDA